MFIIPPRGTRLANLEIIRSSLVKEPQPPSSVSPPDPAPPDAPAPPPAEPWAQAAPPDNELESLDPAVVKYWRVHSVISSLVLMGLLTIAAMVILLNHFSAWPIVAGVWGAFLLLRLWLLTWLPRRSYQAWGYRMDDKVLETRHGIWFKVITLLPLSRLQHVDLERGPLERSFGLASLLLHTAGTQNASISIPGLNADKAARLRDQLVAAGGDDGV